MNLGNLASKVLVTVVMTPDPYCVKEGTKMGKVLSDMAERHIGSAIVVNNIGEFRAILDGGQVIDSIAHEGEQELKERQVEEFAIRHVPRADTKDTVSEVARMMDQHNVHYLVVLDGVQPVGVVSQGDIIRWWVREFGNAT